jgi:hypothetical protein
MTRRHTKRKGLPVRLERKQRVTITLSRHSAEYVRAISVRERSHASTVMERMIETSRRAQELKQLSLAEDVSPIDLKCLDSQSIRRSSATMSECRSRPKIGSL